MYTDERFCAPCCEKGLFKDGDNYCKQCRNYICLICAQAHGQKCSFNDKNVRNVDTIKGNTTGRDYEENGKRIWLKKYHCGGNEDENERTFDVFQKYSAKERKQTICDKERMNGSYEDCSCNQKEKMNKLPNSEPSRQCTLHETPFCGEKKTLSGKSSGVKTGKYSARGGVIKIANQTDPVRQKLLRCHDHPEMAIENFCSTHNALSCEECLSTDHKQCTVQPVDEIAHGILESGEIEKTEAVIRKLKDKINEMKRMYQKRIDLMQSDIKKEEITTEINHDEITDKTKKYDQTVKCNSESELRSKIAKCNELEEDTSLCMSEIQKAKERECEISIFVTLLRNQRICKAASKIIQEFVQANTVQAVTAKDMKDDQTPIKENEIFEKSSMKPVVDTNNTKPDISNENTPSKDFEMHHSSHLTTKFVIGDVIIGSENNNEDTDAVQEKSPKIVYKSETEKHCYKNDENDDVDPKTLRSIEMTTKLSEQQSTTLCTNKKSIAFSDQIVSRSVFQKQIKGHVKSNGMVTEYYLNDNEDDDIFEGIRVLRIKSAPPETSLKRTTDVNNRHQTKTDPTACEMAQWQNRKLLESVEHSKDTCQSNDILSIRLQQRCRSAYSSRRKYIESNETKRSQGAKSEQRDSKTKIKLLKMPRMDNGRCPRKKTILSKKRPSESSLNAMIKRYESRGETERLKEWIKQTDEMNRIYKIEKAKLSTKPDNDDIKPKDEVDEVYAANVNDVLDDYDDEHSALLPTIPLMVKEATVIKTVNPNERQSSAKSRASDSEEFLYNSQVFALRPKSQVILTAEQIIRLPEDERMSEINSIACMPDGRIVVSDFSNMLIKMFRVGWGKASKLILDEPPHGVAVVSNSTLAVISGFAYDRLLVVSAGQCLVIKRRYNTGCVCKAIASHESHIYLLCLYRYKTEVRIVNTDGVVSIRLYLGHAIPSPQSIAVRATNGLIYIVDKLRGVLGVELGKIVSHSFDKNIENYLGIAMDINNNIFVCTRTPCGIYELSQNAKHMMPILLGYGVENVTAVAFNSASNSLVVACAKCETIQIYKINDTLHLKKA